VGFKELERKEAARPLGSCAENKGFWVLTISQKLSEGLRLKKGGYGRA